MSKVADSTYIWDIPIMVSQESSSHCAQVAICSLIFHGVTFGPVSLKQPRGIFRHP